MNRTVEMAFEFPLQFRIAVEFVEHKKKYTDFRVKAVQ